MINTHSGLLSECKLWKRKHFIFIQEQFCNIINVFILSKKNRIKELKTCVCVCVCVCVHMSVYNLSCGDN